jgi:hypothetical protein
MIQTITPGLYFVQVGFFVANKPRATLLVNSESVITDESSASAKMIGRHSAGNIVGTTIADVISLPPRSRISVQYEGDMAVEGFLSLRKL